MTAMIDVQNLVKWYGPTLAINRLNFTIPGGKIVGFLGPNGAGKSTTLRILTGYLPPTSGRARIAGHDVLTESLLVRAKIGYLPENNPLYPEMRVEQYLHFRGKLYAMDRTTRCRRIDLVCDRCGLVAIRKRVIGRLSKGNRQRVGLAAAILHDPRLLILDEPTAGLDPNQITHFRDLVRDLSGQHTVVLSTHILSEVEKSADHVLIISGGRIVAEGSPQELRQRVASGSRLLVELQAPSHEAGEVLRKIESIEKVETSMRDGWCHVMIDPKDGQDVRELVGTVLCQKGWPIREMRQDSGNLEQFFATITGQQQPEPRQGHTLGV